MGILLGLAAYFDAREYKVPNWIIAVGLLGSMVLRIWNQGPHGLGQWFVAVACIFILFFPFSVLRMFGAGDVKLSMVIAGAFGTAFTLECVFVALLFGAVFSIIRMLRHRNLFYRLQNLATYLYLIFVQKKLRPYGDCVEDIPENARIRFVIPMALGYVYMLTSSLWNVSF